MDPPPTVDRMSSGATSAGLELPDLSVSTSGIMTKQQSSVNFGFASSSKDLSEAAAVEATPSQPSRRSHPLSWMASLTSFRQTKTDDDRGVSSKLTAALPFAAQRSRSNTAGARKSSTRTTATSIFSAASSRQKTRDDAAHRKSEQLDDLVDKYHIRAMESFGEEDGKQQVLHPDIFSTIKSLGTRRGYYQTGVGLCGVFSSCTLPWVLAFPMGASAETLLYCLYATDFVYLCDLLTTVVEVYRIYTSAYAGDIDTAPNVDWHLGLAFWGAVSFVNAISFNLQCVFVGLGDTPREVVQRERHDADALSGHGQGKHLLFFTTGLWFMLQSVVRLYTFLR